MGGDLYEWEHFSLTFSFSFFTCERVSSLGNGLQVMGLALRDIIITSYKIVIAFHP
jgi:hypothetical protein